MPSNISIKINNACPEYDVDEISAVMYKITQEYKTMLNLSFSHCLPSVYEELDTQNLHL